MAMFLWAKLLYMSLVCLGDTQLFDLHIIHTVCTFWSTHQLITVNNVHWVCSAEHTQNQVYLLFRVKHCRKTTPPTKHLGHVTFPEKGCVGCGFYTQLVWKKVGNNFYIILIYNLKYNFSTYKRCDSIINIYLWQKTQSKFW